MIFHIRVFAFGSALAFCNAAILAQQPAPQPYSNDMVESFKAPVVEMDYDRRVEMVPMRDGTKLYTVISVPHGAKNAPILLTRTCYDAASRATRSKSGKMIEALPLSDEPFVEAGYIRVYQDVRGKYGSEGPYLMTPPPVGSGFNKTGADDTMDAYDTIDWLVKNVPESNGRVGMIGSSYEGYTVVMALLNPHPALKAAVPESPMVDGWMGDDWFHYGAFRQTGNIDYILGQTTRRGQGVHVPREGKDDYTNFLKAGSASDFAKQVGAYDMPFYQDFVNHEAYDGYWQTQALDKLIAKMPLTVPTMWEQGLWDQEDMWGAIHSYRTWEPKDTSNTMNYLVMGPWFHSQINREGRQLGPLIWAQDTASYWRREVLVPFFNQYLKDGAKKADTPPVLVYDTGLDKWDRYQSFPTSCETGCSVPSKPLYLASGGKLSFEKPSGAGAEFDEYVSDPMKPVPYRPRPVDPADGMGWRTWLVTDQRFVDGRPDVLTWVSEPLKEPMKLSGEPTVHLVASTSGTDSDWVVKLIDVYPDRVAPPTDFSGYELPIATDIFRGRYRQSFEKPEAIKANEPLPYVFGLPEVNHTFLPGHRVMVQVQSTLFPLYDRNPQTFVPSVLNAKPGDYQKATQRVWHTQREASYISLPVVPAEKP
ncbi:MAG TPA: CocE/NonD family hydrolase [Acidobacteriaceae bacterium]|jgi:hypothetical protein|nr:CocE/NonD family hydrolase [Acidobacteriaceae bacterium]